MDDAAIRRLALALALCAGTWGMAGAAGAQQPAQERVQEKAGDAGAARDPIFGRQLMTDDEIRAHRQKVRSLQTEEERRAYREEHHRRMLERARERGVTLPEEPPGRGPGMGTGRGEGPGPAPGPRPGPGGPGGGGGMGPRGGGGPGGGGSS
jgi:hypothetical protein